MTLTAKTLEKRLNEIEASSTPERTMKVKLLLTKLGIEKGYKVAVTGEGFIITAYITDTIKEGEQLWPTSA